MQFQAGIPVARRPLSGAAAAAAPILCAVHCLAAPVLVGIAPALVENPAVERLLAGASSVFVAGVAVHGVRQHGQRWILGLVAVGVLLLWAGSLDRLGQNAEHLAVLVGSLALAATVVWNARLVRHCACERNDRGGICIPPAGARIADWAGDPALPAAHHESTKLAG